MHSASTQPTCPFSFLVWRSGRPPPPGRRRGAYPAETQRRRDWHVLGAGMCSAPSCAALMQVRTTLIRNIWVQLEIQSCVGPTPARPPAPLLVVSEVPGSRRPGCCRSYTGARVCPCTHSVAEIVLVFSLVRCNRFRDGRGGRRSHHGSERLLQGLHGHGLLVAFIFPCTPD